METSHATSRSELWFALLAFSMMISCRTAAAAVESFSPVVVYTFRLLHEPVLLPSGSLMAIAIRYANGVQVITGQRSSNDGRSWTQPQYLETLPRSAGIFGYYRVLVDRDGEVHIFLLADANTGAALPLKGTHGKPLKQVLDIWQVRSRDGRKLWGPARCIWQGRAGDLLSAIQLRDGRILLPICYLTSRRWDRRAKGSNEFDYKGPFEASAVYSDDDGKTWRASVSRLNVPVPTLSAEGAVEPVVLQLKDGRVWMLIRTQLGRFYESFSADGAHWSRPEPTGIISSDSPAGLLRLRDGRIFLLVNDCQRYAYAFGGRFVLLGAISDDEGRTWHGYREIARDPFRLKPPPSSGDFGVAYPFPTLTSDGRVLFTLGIATGTRNQVPEGPAGVKSNEKRVVVLVDPSWLDEHEQECNFSGGLKGWSTFGTRGVGLVPDPQNESKSVLQISKPDAGWPAGAIWNFPAGRRGSLRLQIFLYPGCQGLHVGLTDQFSVPWDREDRFYNVFNFELGPGGRLHTGYRLIPNRWHELQFDWDCDESKLEVKVDNHLAETITMQRPPQSQGVCYLRLRSTATRVDSKGVLIGKLVAHITRAKP